MDIQHIEYKHQQKTSSNRRNIVPYKEIIRIKEPNSGVTVFTGNS